MTRYVVSITREDDPVAAVRNCIAHLGGMERVVRPKDKVLIKPNNLIQQYVPGTVTSAEVVGALALLVKEAGGKPVVGENNLTPETECGSRYRAALSKAKLGDVPLVDLMKDPMVAVEIKGARVLHKTSIAKTALEADKLIDVPVMKTHDQTQVSLGIKNLKGLIPLAEKKRSHEVGVEQAIVDLCGFVRPALVVIDGITAAEGMGPVNGTPFRMNTIIAGTNALAADMVGATVMGFEIERIKFLTYAIESGIGPKSLREITVVGLPISTVRRPFVTAESVVIRQYREMGIQVISRNACSGCWAEFRHIHYSLQDDRVKLKGTTFVLGRVEDLPPVENAIIIGRCAEAVAGRGVYVRGCPPHHSAIEAAARERIGMRS